LLGGGGTVTTTLSVVESVFEGELYDQAEDEGK
jgi:hypothetical protein